MFICVICGWLGSLAPSIHQWRRRLVAVQPPAPCGRAVCASLMASWRDAVQPGDDGVTLLLQASPGAGHTRFPDGYNPWRGRLGIRVREAARDGRANQAVLDAVAAFFGLQASRVQLLGGAQDTRKLVWVQGLTVGEARARLAPALEA